MPGRIRDEDIALVNEKVPIADVIGDYVQLRNAGGGNLKGLCPFHDEKTPSFSVSPARGYYHCFGCNAGGDVIRFVRDIEHLDFLEAVERLAARANITLRYVDGPPARDQNRGFKTRLLEAHRAAAAFYVEALRDPSARAAREFLQGRGFDEQVAARFGCGYAPDGWDQLTTHLLAKGFSAAELTGGGLSRESPRGGLIDRFHRRLLWPIRDVAGDVVGFGARRLYDDDRIEAKYLNTPETPIYKKSQLLYGVDLAKRDIARQHRAVVVEGYTDVMACHLAGVTTAVASCGTAFGSEHVSVLRRLLMDSDAFSGEVIFTFDGDAAGMKAAERAFKDDQKFMSQTFVAVEPTGLDPCDLRMSGGDAAVRDLVGRRIPLVEFMLRGTVGRFDLDTAEGRANALDQGVPLVADIKDHSLRDEYARRLAGLVGVDDPMRVVARVRGLIRSGARRADTAAAPAAASGAPSPGGPNPAAEVTTAPRPAAPVVSEAVAVVEREVLKIALQLPGLAGPLFDTIDETAFLLPAHRRLRAAIAAAGGPGAASAGPGWLAAVEAQLPEELRSGVHALTVEPLRSGPESQERYVDSMLYRLQEMVVGRQIQAIKSKVQRLNPQESPDEHANLFGQLITLESHRRSLRERAIGSS